MSSNVYKTFFNFKKVVNENKKHLLFIFLDLWITYFEETHLLQRNYKAIIFHLKKKFIKWGEFYRYI